MENKHLKLFSNCIPCKGIKYSTINDLQKGEYFVVPISLIDILTKCKTDSIKEVKLELSTEQHPIFEEYIEFILSNNLGFLVEKVLLENFSDMNAEWNSSSIITNAIFDYSLQNKGFLEQFLEALQSLQCAFLEIRVFELISKENLFQILEVINKSSLRGVTLHVKFNSDDFTVDEIENKIKSMPGYLNINLFECKINYYFKDTINEVYLTTTENRLNEKSCGYITKDFFAVNIKTWSEGLHHNTCLNRKISVDKNGNIKNCPSMVMSYGNIKNTSLIDAISRPEFKKLWDIDKSQISVCKSCEFRYICTDCRAYLQEPEDIYSKPLKCGYDPFIGVWQEWSTNPLSKKGINYYNLKEIL